MKTSDVTRLLVFFSLFSCAMLALSAPGELNYLIKAGEREFLVELADTQELKRQGLMNRKTMPGSHGLLMIFKHDKLVPIWMKNMQFPIDVVWLSSEGVVIDIKTLPVCKEMPCKVFYPAQPARFVLEVGASLFPLNLGDKVEIIDASRDSLLPTIHGSEKHAD